jgi:hypothetical protein
MESEGDKQAKAQEIIAPAGGCGQGKIAALSIYFQEKIPAYYPTEAESAATYPVVYPPTITTVTLVTSVGLEKQVKS